MTVGFYQKCVALEERQWRFMDSMPSPYRSIAVRFGGPFLLVEQVAFRMIRAIGEGFGSLVSNDGSKRSYVVSFMMGVFPLAPIPLTYYLAIKPALITLVCAINAIVECIFLEIYPKTTPRVMVNACLLRTEEVFKELMKKVSLQNLGTFFALYACFIQKVRHAKTNDELSLLHFLDTTESRDKVCQEVLRKEEIISRANIYFNSATTGTFFYRGNIDAIRDISKKEEGQAICRTRQELYQCLKEYRDKVFRATIEDAEGMKFAPCYLEKPENRYVVNESIVEEDTQSVWYKVGALLAKVQMFIAFT